jgi:hypothetical protein
MDNSFNEFCDATKLRPNFMDERDEHTHAESHQLAESSHAVAVQQQQFLQAFDTVK